MTQIDPAKFDAARTLNGFRMSSKCLGTDQRMGNMFASQTEFRRYMNIIAKNNYTIWFFHPSRLYHISFCLSLAANEQLKNE